jgi:RHS repeat-associated protein
VGAKRHHRYTGQKLDLNTGLMYYGARYYDRHIGTFISPDTLVPDPTNVWDYNRFAYARLNPLKYNDPTGRAARFTCLPFICNAEWFEYSEVSGFADTAADAVAWVSCLALGCHADLERNVVTGPTEQEAFEQSASSVMSAGLNPIGMVHVPGTGRLVNQAAQTGSQATSKTLASFARAAEFGIRPAGELKKAVGNGSGLHVHHIVERRFARILGVADENGMLSVVLKPEEHAWFTAKWKEEIGLSSWTSRSLRTDNASREDIWRAAQKIYQDHPELLGAAQRTIFGE